MGHGVKHGAGPRKCFAKRWRLGVRAFCLLLLGAALGACPSSNPERPKTFHGARTVSFDKNGGDTEAMPESITLHPPATTLGSLPEEPTRSGHTFGGWNTERDGSGTPFTASTPVEPTILTIVYAQWKPHLGLLLPRDTLSFSPMVDGEYDERFPAFTVTVSGFKNAADASKATLEARATSGNERQWFSWQVEHGPYAEGVQTFVLYFVYRGTNLSEGPATLSIQLKDIPAGYEYVDSPKTLRVSATNGQDKSRPIPVHQGNLEHFNRYANTTEGLKLHYQLIENVSLRKPAAEKSNWVPIGTAPHPYTNVGADKPFLGSFDGGGHSIFGLVIYAPGDVYQGMFGVVGEGAEIKNLGLEGGSVSGGGYVGSVAGKNEGTVLNCYATGGVSGGGGVGGVAGYNSGTVQDSYATGNVDGGNNGTDVGGVVGGNEGAVQNSHATGNVNGRNAIGGVVGMNYPDGIVQKCYATGNVSSTYRYAGGVVGWNFSIVENCYATGNVDGDINVGGVVGLNDGRLEKCYATGNINGSWRVGGVIGEGRSIVQNCVALNPSITKDIDSFGRVAGLGGGLNNYARSDMKLNYVPNIGPDSGDGADVFPEEWNSATFWRTTVHFSDELWNLQDGKLPTLKNVGGVQNPTVLPVQ